MNLATIYGLFDKADRDLIITSMRLYKTTATRGVKIKDWQPPLHNTIMFLNARMTRKALLNQLTAWQQLITTETDTEIANRLNRMIKLIDSIL